MYLLATTVFQKAISRLQKLASRKAKNVSKNGDISTETQTARGGNEEILFNVDPERATEQQGNSSKQRQTKKRTCQESEEEIEREDALNLMFEYFDKKNDGMQAQINKNMEPPVKNYKLDGHEIKGKDSKDQFDFKKDIYFAIQECQQQITRGNIEDPSANLTSTATKVNRNNLIKLADLLPVGQSIVQEYIRDPTASDSDDAQKSQTGRTKGNQKKESKNTRQF